jgi:cation diffusion facilitator CzcD-associated flavoprotein CzcO
VNESPAFDIGALRKRYQFERERRLRPDGIEQYVEVAGDFSTYARDPWAEALVERAPLFDDVDVALVGAGFGGLLTGARLRELGVDKIRLIDKAADVGGTWYWNRYPGVACDVESYIYMPLLEETHYMPKEKYSKGDEIFEHCQRIATKFDLYRHALFQTEISEMRWDEEVNRWIITTNRGDCFRAKFVSLATGHLQKPKLPGIPGIETFNGHAFHTSRWDFDYTGGDSHGDLTNLADKRVGIIGTGATAVQCIPHLGRDAQELLVFQRTPSSVDVRANRPTDPTWIETLTPGWQRARIENFQILTAGGIAEEDLVDDAWTSITKKLLAMRLNNTTGLSAEELAATMELADFTKMEEVRARVDVLVEDPAVADALKPWYRQFCKRPCFHDEYLQTFNRDNVTLVDTQGKGVERISESGVVVNGVEYELDCLIFSTGFEVGTDYAHRTGFEIYGRAGVSLSEAWSDGVRTLHGLLLHRFPNLFMQSIAQAGFTVNFPYLIEIQATHSAWLINEALQHGIDSIEPTATAESAWVETIVQRNRASAESSANCTPGYYNKEGMPDDRSRQSGMYFGSPTEYGDILRQWREDGKLSGTTQQREG